MNLHEKLLEIQRSVDSVLKDAENTSDKYTYASSKIVLDAIRPKMNQLGLMLIPKVVSTALHEGVTRSGTTRYLTEVTYNMVWIDVESGEALPCPWYAQGADLAGEKGPGKAATYAEKYFLLKFFHVPTDKDDPDGDGRTRSGERPIRGTAAAAELCAYHRRAIAQMFRELYNGDEEKIRAGLLAATKSKSRGYEGTDSVDKLSAAACAVVYAKVKKTYEQRLGKAFAMEEDADHAGD